VAAQRASALCRSRQIRVNAQRTHAPSNCDSFRSRSPAMDAHKSKSNK